MCWAYFDLPFHMCFCNTRLLGSMGAESGAGGPLQAKLTRHIAIVIAVEVLVLVIHSPVRTSIHGRVVRDKDKGVSSRVPAVAQHFKKNIWEDLQ